MTRWLPHVHLGGATEECTRDDEGGREGWYVCVCWLGFMVSFTFTSIYAERRWLGRNLPVEAAPEAEQT